MIGVDINGIRQSAVIVIPIMAMAEYLFLCFSLLVIFNMKIVEHKKHNHWPDAISYQPLYLL